MLLPRRKLIVGAAASILSPYVARAQVGQIGTWPPKFPAPSGGGGGGSCPTCTTGIVGYWKFDENTGSTTADATGNGNTLTITSSDWVPGKINSALSYNGTSTENAYVGPLNSSNVLYLPAAWSISAWVNFPSLTTPPIQCIMEMANNNTTELYYIYVGYASGYLLRFGSGYLSYFTTPFSPVANTWYHLVGTFDGTSTIVGYLNGTSLGSTGSASPSSIGTTGYYFQVGASYGAGNLLTAIVDEVGVWSRVLTATEVSDLYNSGAGLQYPF